MATPPRTHRVHATPRPDGCTAPCHCGQPIPTGRTAYCCDRCKWADTDHGRDYDTEDAA
jgi:hypothetical protein